VYIAWVPSDPLLKKEHILTSSFVLLELVFSFGILIEMPNSKQECSLQFAFFMVWNALFSLILSRGINDFSRNFADFVWLPLCGYMLGSIGGDIWRQIITGIANTASTVQPYDMETLKHVLKKKDKSETSQKKSVRNSNF
jgi:hypothetical protein